VAQEKSGLYYPNKIGRIYLMAMEEVMGTNGIKAVLNLAKIPELINNYPPNNLAREFDFADFGAIFCRWRASTQAEAPLAEIGQPEQ